MRGIAGVIYPDVFQMNQLVIPMLDALKHRGKDTQDIYTYKNVEFGVHGGSVYQDPLDKVIVMLDGTLYNLSLLKQGLESLGHSFYTEKPEEVLANGYFVWGTSLFEKLHGDFALAIFDRRLSKIYLARDRIGKKPLYWYQDNQLFLFGSELKALIATGCVPQTPAPDALAQYLFFGFIPQDMSPVKGVNKLLPAYYLELHTNKSLHIENFWSFSEVFHNKKEDRKENATDALHHKLEEATKIRIPQEESLGCFVSGGLGSASIAYYVDQNKGSRKVEAYSSGFLGENDSDILAAKDVTTTLHLPHTTRFITRDTFLDNIIPVCWHLDEPIADTNPLSMWLMAEAAAEKTKTVFSGMGADELLAQHGRYTAEERSSSPFFHLALLPKPLLRKVIVPVLHFINKSWSYEMLKYLKSDPQQIEYLTQTALMDEATLEEASPRLCRLFDPDVFLHKFYHIERTHTSTSAIMYFDIKTRLADHYILQYERLTAAHGLEWRTPFLDRHIVEFLASIPEPETLSEKEAGMLLKSVMQPHLPLRFLNRPKRTRKGFLKNWIEMPHMVSLFKELLKGGLVDSGFISHTWLEEQIDHITTSTTAFKHLWALLMLEIWFKLYINNSIETTPPNVTLEQLLREY